MQTLTWDMPSLINFHCHHYFPVLLFCLIYFLFLAFDLCMMDNGGCEHNCVSIGTSYYCACNSGYELNSDGTTCQQAKQFLHDIVLPFHS